MRVLLVEENLTFRESFRDELLRRFPFVSLLEAKEGGEALEKIRRLLPSLLFLDIGLPGGNGLHLAWKIKEEFPSIRIAMLTSYDFPEYRWAASQSGADRYFLKDSLDWKEVEEFLQSVPEDER